MKIIPAYNRPANKNRVLLKYDSLCKKKFGIEEDQVREREKKKEKQRTCKGERGRLNGKMKRERMRMKKTVQERKREK